VEALTVCSIRGEGSTFKLTLPLTDRLIYVQPEQTATRFPS
jgi:hypothetical protein